jgi:TatD DNase family protein
MRFFDSHAHLDHEGFPEGVDDLLARARTAGVAWVTTIGSSANVDLMREAVRIARDNEGVFAAVGIHPHEAAQADTESFDGLLHLIDAGGVVAVGECGLDFHYMHSPKPAQFDVFRRQIRIAHDFGLPLVIHCRDAHEECVRVLSEGPLNEMPGVIHCFSGTRTQMQDYLELGFYISIPGIVTFKKAADLREAVNALPMDRILIETDSPYLAPVPFRGKRNEPAYVVHTARAIAEIKGVGLDLVASVTADNAKRLYGIEDG